MSTLDLSEVPTAKNRGCCYAFCKCFYSSDEEFAHESKNLLKTVKQKVKEEIKETEKNNNEASIVHNTVSPNENDVLFLHVKESTQNFIIKSKISIDQIEFDIKMKRDQKVDIKYNCPICMRYFNYILQTSCCNNYLCRFCSDEYLDSMIKYQNKIKCPVCNVTAKIVLTDVKPGTEVN
jgi:hypothetical protein